MTATVRNRVLCYRASISKKHFRRGRANSAGNSFWGVKYFRNEWSSQSCLTKLKYSWPKLWQCCSSQAKY